VVTYAALSRKGRVLFPSAVRDSAGAWLRRGLTGAARAATVDDCRKGGLVL